MLISFDEIIDITLHHEGGYVHDPKDLGGETNYGIAKRFYPEVDIKNLTKDEAKDMNKKAQELKLKKVKLEQKEYAYNSAVLNPENENAEGIVSADIFSMDSVQAKNPIPIGTLFFKNSAKEGEDPKYKPTNYTFLRHISDKNYK